MLTGIINIKTKKAGITGERFAEVNCLDVTKLLTN
jgi:hypothetical protein